MLPETDVARIRRWLAARNDRLPERARGQIRYELDVDARAVTILECRPPWKPGRSEEWSRFPIVRLRYSQVRREWALYWQDRNLRFHAYDLAAPSSSVEELLTEVDADPTGIFWG